MNIRYVINVEIYNASLPVLYPVIIFLTIACRTTWNQVIWICTIFGNGVCGIIWSRVPANSKRQFGQRLDILLFSSVVSSILNSQNAFESYEYKSFKAFLLSSVSRKWVSSSSLSSFSKRLYSPKRRRNLHSMFSTIPLEPFRFLESTYL